LVGRLDGGSVGRLFSLGNEKTVKLLESTVFMNDSGRFVKKLVERYKTPLDHLLIIQDDLDIPVGEFRMQKGRGAAGHKGVESVIAALGSRDFWRLRIGIGRPKINEKLKIKNEKLVEKYVLEEFSDKDLRTIENLIPRIIGTINGWVISKE